MNEYLKPIAESFQKHSNPENIPAMKAYMRDQFEFFGLKTPLRRSLSKEFFAKYGVPDNWDLAKYVEVLFDLSEREFHYFAIELCGKLRKDWTKDTIGLFEKMVLKKSWWDSVDSINIVCIKPYFARFPEDRYQITQTWIDSNNIWLQRLSVICQLRLTGQTDTKLLSRNIMQLKESDEFFIQKAIGWALRDLAKTDPGWVRKFVLKNHLKPLSKREALKHLSPNAKK